MSEAASALDGAQYRGAATVTETGLCGMVTLRGDPREAALGRALATHGLTLPGRRAITGVGAGTGSGIGTGAGGLSLLWMSPDEMLLLCPYADAVALTADLQGRLAGVHALAVDVSDARARFRVAGPGARDVLAKGAPVDFSPAAFRAGSVRRSRLGQVPAAFWVSGADSIDVLCSRSVARHVFDWLVVASAPGSLPGYHAPV